MSPIVSKDVKSQVTEKKGFINVTSKDDIYYDVLLNNHIFDVQNESILRYCKGKKIIVYVSKTVYEVYGDRIQNYFDHHFKDNQYKLVKLFTSEENKQMDMIFEICDEARKFHLDRRSIMIGIGGGVLLDLVGFAASMYRRKIDYIRIPTTLLAQIDAGIGIKTGVNYKGSKNFLGSYYAPLVAINDLELLSTLDKVEIICGLAEIIKMGIILDEKLFELVEEYQSELIMCKYQSHEQIAIEINKRAILRMLESLCVNFHEKHLERLVDFGHSFSQYIEEFTDFKVKHGLAVAKDIAISTEISYQINKIDLEDRDRIINLILNLGVKVYEEDIFDVERMWTSLEKVELHRANRLNLVIPTKVGEASFIRDKNEISKNLLGSVLNNLNNIQLSFLQQGGELNY